MDGKKAAMPPCALNADLICGRDAIGDSSIIGDDRWAGTLGIRADFVARTHCSVAFIPTKDILVPASEILAPHMPLSPNAITGHARTIESHGDCLSWQLKSIPATRATPSA